MGCGVDESGDNRSDASSGFSGALYDAAGPNGAHPTGAPHSQLPQNAPVPDAPAPGSPNPSQPPLPNWEPRGSQPPLAWEPGAPGTAAAWVHGGRPSVPPYSAPSGPPYSAPSAPPAGTPAPPYAPYPTPPWPAAYGPAGNGAPGYGAPGYGAPGYGSPGFPGSPTGYGPYGAAPGYPVGVPPSGPPASPAPDGAFWSDAANDPWRDPRAPAAVVVTAENESPEVKPPDFSKKTRTASLAQVLIISLVAALLAGGLGGALGYTVATGRGGAGTVLGNSGAPSIANRAPTSIAGVAKAVLPSVVMIQVPADGGLEVGSGFIVSTDGYILTNQHVVADLKGSATVTFNDTTTSAAKVVGTDPSSDIAVLKVSKSGLPAVTFGDSDSVAVGDPVIAIGSPLGLSSTVTYGIISALRRPLEITEGGSPTRYYSAIQTDAAINHGNSGGPLFDGAGRVVGVDAAILTGSSSDDSGNIGVGFAIPIDQARRIAGEIIDGAPIQHAVIGATPQSSFSSGPSGGVPIGSVTPGGPAATAGIQPGDVIMEVGGSPLTESGDLTALVREYAPGSVVPVVITHLGQRKTVAVKLASDNG